MHQRWNPTIFGLLATIAWLSAVFCFIQIPLTKVRTDWAMDVIRDEYVNAQTLDDEQRERFEFFERWIRGNQIRSNKAVDLLRWTGTIGFGVFGAVFVILARREKRSNHRLHLTGGPRE